MMEPSDVAPALIKVINNKSYNGDLIAVDTGNDHHARLEPLDEYGAFEEYGKWSEMTSLFTKISVDKGIKDLQTSNTNIWSGSK